MVYKANIDDKQAFWNTNKQRTEQSNHDNSADQLC